MIRALLVANRQSVNKTTQEKELWLTMYQLPRLFKAKDGTLGKWYPKNSDALFITCIVASDKPDDYNRLKNAKEGSICLITLGVNDFTNKTTVARVEIEKNSDVHSAESLYGKL